MQCYVYKSQRRADTYLYLRNRDGFGDVPSALIDSLGRLELVLEFDLAPGRRLARASAEDVKADLARVGFYLQFPPPLQIAPIVPTF